MNTRANAAGPAPTRSQRGATLITVMVIMVVITLLGLTAMRMGISSLALASNSQAGNILFQESDVGLVEFSRQVNATPGAADTAFLAGAVAKSPSPGTCDESVLPEFNYCFTPKLATRVTEGTCDVTNSNHYMTGRDTVAVQVTVKPICILGMTLGSDPGAVPPIIYHFLVYSTAVLPSFGAASKSQINACLQKKNDDGDSFRLVVKDPDSQSELLNRQQNTETVTDCLTDKGAVFTTTLNQFSYGVNM